jgi:hypothetical protein
VKFIFPKLGECDSMSASWKDDRAFGKWLRQQAARDDRVGDLARDAKEDRALKLPYSYNRMADRMGTLKAFAAAVDTLDAAGHEYEAVLAGR